jgi:hypothetical protein
VLKRVACCALRSSIHKADAALTGGRPTQRRILVVAVAIRASVEMIPILKLISSVVVAIPTDYTRYR